MTLAKSSWVGGASWAEVSAAAAVVSRDGRAGRGGCTQGDVVVGLDGHVLLDLDLVDGLEDGQAVADAADAHFLELGMLQGGEDVAGDALVWGR